MQSIWIDPARLQKAAARNEAFFSGELEEYPLLWITAPTGEPSRLAPPADELQLWLDPQYVVEAADDRFSRTCFVADALPVHNPWLGPNQVAAWLGGELKFDIARHNTSWTDPFVEDLSQVDQLRIDPDNQWWRIYLDLLRASAEAGKDRWAVCYPDLHTGIDALSALRGPDRLALDLMLDPDSITRLMPQLTRLFKEIVDQVSEIILPYGQGSSNWTMGWSSRRFVCIGQNDFTCMISNKMFREFVLNDVIETARHVDHSLYHLDGTGALHHLPTLLEIPELNAIQWVPGAGKEDASRWMDLLRSIQAAGKGVTMLPTSPEDALDCCRELDISRLFLWVEVETPEQAEDLFTQIRRLCADRRRTIIPRD